MDEKNNSSDAVASPLLAGHTPGPWEITGPYAIDPEFPEYRIGAPGMFIAAVNARDNGYDNALLIAAAPALLAALKKMHAAFNATKPIPKAEGDALESMCLSAITAAEGK